jgi:signal transduction histidine kinase
VRGAPAGCDAYLWEVVAREPAIYSVGVASPAGEVTCSSHAAARGMRVADQAYFQKAVETGGFSTGTFERDRASGRVAIHFAQPVVEGGEVQAVIFLALDLQWLDGFARRVELPEGSAVMAWDSSGTILASFRDPERWVGRSLAGEEVLRRSLAARRGVVEVTGWNGQQYAWAFTAVGPEGADEALHLGVAVPMDAVLGSVARDLREHLLLLWGAGLLAALALWGAVYSWVIRPLRSVERAAVALGEGHLDVRSRVQDAPDELGRVSAAFDVMAASIEDGTRGRETFINLVAHELKTPLTVFRLHLQRLRLSMDRGEQVPAEQVRRAVDAADRQVWRLGQLVESLLDSRALAEDTRPLQLERMELRTVVAEVVRHHQPSFDAAGTALKVDVEEPICVVWDRGLVVQLLNQLLSNALKFGGRKPVTLVAVEEEGQVQIQIHDAGPGIPFEHQERVFERFDRTGATQAQGGLGLGLWVVRQIARRMQGEVTLRSRPGVGATFIVTLPSDLSLDVAAPHAARGYTGPPVDAQELGATLQ